LIKVSLKGTSHFSPKTVKKRLRALLSLLAMRFVVSWQKLQDLMSNILRITNSLKWLFQTKSKTKRSKNNLHKQKLWWRFWATKLQLQSLSPYETTEEMKLMKNLFSMPLPLWYFLRISRTISVKQDLRPL